MTPLLLALALLAQDAAPADTTPDMTPSETDAQAAPAVEVAGKPAPSPEVQPEPEPEPAKVAAFEEPPYPTGAPQGDYPFVSWCYGVLSGYLDLYDQVMPEVTRIETTWRAPGSDLAEDLKAYEIARARGREDLALFARAMEAAEKASIRPINAQGAEALKRGRANWTAAAAMPKARVAQEWMSWVLPKRCPWVAERLEERASLLAATFDPGAAVEPPPLSEMQEVPLDEPAPATESPEPADADAPSEPRVEVPQT